MYYRRMRVLSRTCAECEAEITPDDERFELVLEPPGAGVVHQAATDEWLCSDGCVAKAASRAAGRENSGVLSRIDPLSAVIGIIAGFVAATLLGSGVRDEE